MDTAIQYPGYRIPYSVPEATHPTVPWSRGTWVPVRFSTDPLVGFSSPRRGFPSPRSKLGTARWCSQRADRIWQSPASLPEAPSPALHSSAGAPAIQAISQTWWRPSNPDLSRPLPASARRRARRWLPSFIKYLASTVLPSERPVAGTCVPVFSSTRGMVKSICCPVWMKPDASTRPLLLVSWSESIVKTGIESLAGVRRSLASAEPRG